jgi:hypothetical protein
MTAGEHACAWDLRDDAGREVDHGWLGDVDQGLAPGSIQDALRERLTAASDPSHP